MHAYYSKFPMPSRSSQSFGTISFVSMSAQCKISSSSVVVVVVVIIIIRQQLCQRVGRRHQHAVSKLPCLVLSSAISCRSSRPCCSMFTYIAETNWKKYGYADDLALLKVHQDWNTIEETLTQDMSILSSWLNQWRLKLSEAKTVPSTFHLNNREAKRELNVNISGRRLTCHRTPTYLGVKLDRTLTYREHLTALRGKVMARTALIRRLAGTSWGASTPTLRTSTLALVYAPGEYCTPVWCRSSHTRIVDVGLNASLRTITGCLRPTQVDQLPVLADIAPPALRREPWC